jgi:toxin ParE1/3/4
VASYRLSRLARSQLLAIHDYSESKFGRYQADAYHAGLEHTFRLLSDFPRIGLAVDELAPGLRRYRYQSHYVFYVEEADSIFIRAILHTAQDIRPQLFQ